MLFESFAADSIRRALKALGVPTIQGDLRDEAAVNEACRDIEAVFHTAAVPGVWGDWKTYFGINTEGTINVIKACWSSGVARLIYTSSPSVIFDGADHFDADESLPYTETRGFVTIPTAKHWPSRPCWQRTTKVHSAQSLCDRI